MNNPLMYNDPNGEFWVAGWFLTFIAKAITAAIWSAAIGAGLYIAKGFITDNWSLGGFAKAVLLGAVSGFFTGGISSLFSASGFFGTVGVGALTGGVGGGINSLFEGTNFLQGILRGAVFGGAVAGVSYTINYFVKYNSEIQESTLEPGTEVKGNNMPEFPDEKLKRFRDNSYSKYEKDLYRVKGDYVDFSAKTHSDGTFVGAKGSHVIAKNNPNRIFIG